MRILTDFSNSYFPDSPPGLTESLVPNQIIGQNIFGFDNKSIDDPHYYRSIKYMRENYFINPGKIIPVKIFLGHHCIHGIL